MTVYFKWKDKRYKDGVKWTSESIKDEEWKKIKQMMTMLLINQNSEAAENYLRNQFTTSKNRKNLLTIEAEYEEKKINKTEKSYWPIHFEE